jgi:hypothetical protein
MQAQGRAFGCNPSRFGEFFSEGLIAYKSEIVKG